MISGVRTVILTRASLGNIALRELYPVLGSASFSGVGVWDGSL